VVKVVFNKRKEDFIIETAVKLKGVDHKEWRGAALKVGERMLHEMQRGPKGHRTRKMIKHKGRKKEKNKNQKNHEKKKGNRKNERGLVDCAYEKLSEQQRGELSRGANRALLRAHPMGGRLGFAPKALAGA
jgi:hypothetical protein